MVDVENRQSALESAFVGVFDLAIVGLRVLDFGVFDLAGPLIVAAPLGLAKVANPGEDVGNVLVREVHPGQLGHVLLGGVDVL